MIKIMTKIKMINNHYNIITLCHTFITKILLLLEILLKVTIVLIMKIMMIIKREIRTKITMMIVIMINQ